MTESEAAALFGTGNDGKASAGPSTPAKKGRASLGADQTADVDLTEEIDVEDVDVDDDALLEVNSAIAVEKEIAADTIGTIFSATGAHFLPYVERCTLELVALLPHYYEGVRKSAVESLLEVVRSFSALSDPAEWVAGLPGKEGTGQLHKNVKDLVGHCLPPLLEMYETEDDK